MTDRYLAGILGDIGMAVFALGLAALPLLPNSRETWIAFRTSGRSCGGTRLSSVLVLACGA
jgi:hypothetical protein